MIERQREHRKKLLRKIERMEDKMIERKIERGRKG